MPTDVLEDYSVMIEKRDGTVMTFRPEAFRLTARCPSTLLLTTCVARYNARMTREGVADRAALVPRKPR